MKTRTWGRGDVGTWGREIGDACYIAQKREKVTINRSKKLISSNETAQTLAIFLSISKDG